MGKITKAEYNALKGKVELLEQYLNGGKGSGNWGHSGRPGKVGGSGKGGSVSKGRGGSKPAKVTTGSLQEPSIGVGGNDSLDNGLTEVPRLKGLNKKERELEDKIVDCYNDPQKRQEIIDKVIADHDADGDKTYECDGLKEYLPGWGSESRYKELNSKIREDGYENLSDSEKAEYDSMAENRMKNNSIYHNTATALNKAIFEAKVKQMAAKGEDINILMTGGGCGVGKGFGLDELSGKTSFAGVDGEAKVKNDLLNDYKKSTLIYDAAGEQCNSECYWVMNLAVANGGKFTFMQTVSTDSNLTKSIAKSQAKRTQEKGRTVALVYTADSYALGSSNAKSFSQDRSVQSLMATGQVDIYTIKNPGQGNGPLKLSSGIDVSGSSNITEKKFSSHYTNTISGYATDSDAGRATMTPKMLKDALEGLKFK